MKSGNLLRVQDLQPFVGAFNQRYGLHRHHKQLFRKNTRGGLPRRRNYVIIGRPQKCVRACRGWFCHFFNYGRTAVGGVGLPWRTQLFQPPHPVHRLPSVWPELPSRLPDRWTTPPALGFPPRPPVPAPPTCEAIGRARPRGPRLRGPARRPRPTLLSDSPLGQLVRASGGGMGWLGSTRQGLFTMADDLEQQWVNPVSFSFSVSLWAVILGLSVAEEHF